MPCFLSVSQPVNGCLPPKTDGHASLTPQAHPPFMHDTNKIHGLSSSSQRHTAGLRTTPLSTWRMIPPAFPPSAPYVSLRECPPFSALSFRLPPVDGTFDYEALHLPLPPRPPRQPQGLPPTGPDGRCGRRADGGLRGAAAGHGLRDRQRCQARAGADHGYHWWRAGVAAGGLEGADRRAGRGLRGHALRHCHDLRHVEPAAGHDDGGRGALPDGRAAAGADHPLRAHLHRHRLHQRDCRGDHAVAAQGLPRTAHREDAGQLLLAAGCAAALPRRAEPARRGAGPGHAGDALPVAQAAEGDDLPPDRTGTAGTGCGGPRCADDHCRRGRTVPGHH